MLRALYSFVFRLALPFVLLQLWWSSRGSAGPHDNWRERLGWVSPAPAPVVWVHAVSVGETIAAAPLVNALLQRHPGCRILMTAMTATGSARARALFGDRVLYAYSPYDTPGAVSRFLDRVRPAALVIMETELWPNMVGLTEERGIPVVLVNARLSERSARGYRRIAGLVHPMVAQLAWIAAQGADDARRFRAIGASPERVSVTGSIKFDVVVDQHLRAAALRLRAQLGESRPVWIAASTHDGEDEQILVAHRQVLQHQPDALLMLVPRHPERFDAVAQRVQSQGFTLTRRSAASLAAAQVYLGDTMGELLLLYGAADIAFVAGSLIQRGGHNPLEPAAWGLPVLAGPHVFNFEAIYAALDEAGGLVAVQGAESLANAVLALFANAEQRRLTGTSASALIEANRGPLQAVLEGLAQHLPVLSDNPNTGGG
ncbi:MAG: lipid IV(A) 3-deoxy-D-manno-octulosonic acid transferase [Halieaceae bacterium]|uniref:lipid IV(A) 3-deoxy-D-manno-octulosonic acid transferase n=1 Tax=Haliea alexandrii TaxID=2448162 RepID=UPI000F0B1246|nr:lipid IV(A) 3-deoxy-D-manno-octulosonic acid transferase [Haliea alexandrii]MCR9185621.1 lipid IV(A) 3-deoxy-D-manno-octulosonic acid transferase [Halieaceae bacterium]